MEGNHDNAVAKVERHRDDLESLAECDLPVASVAQTLLDAADEYEA